MMIDDLGAQFERETGLKPVIVTDVAAVMKRPVGINAVKAKGMDPG